MYEGLWWQQEEDDTRRTTQPYSGILDICRVEVSRLPRHLFTGCAVWHLLVIPGSIGRPGPPAR